MNTAKIEIRGVRLIDPATGKVLEQLMHREPQMWSGDQYVDWSELLSGLSTLKATYKLSASERISGYSSSDSSRLFGGTTPKYIVEVDVAVDGDVRTLTIEASREPEVVT